MRTALAPQSPRGPLKEIGIESPWSSDRLSLMILHEFFEEPSSEA